ncbi:CoA-transferase [Virgibacillus sp. YIM 98842]|uniref:CoA-transferase n=1 Tax=Virgibacillus sp. YIM 98842 TaxID=2663533 RepID=UPI0013DD13EF|nr:CoA-transferase [Virgibacillus sp. YIM 98842]
MIKVLRIAETIHYIKSGSSLMYGGFGGIGNPPELIKKSVPCRLLQNSVLI